MSGPRVDAVLGRLEKGIRKTSEIFAGLSPEQWQQVLYPDPYPWTVRDLLAHFVSSESALRELAQDVAAGGAGAPEGFSYDGFNAQEHERLRDCPSQDLLADLTAARQATVEWVRTLSEADLDRAGNHPALGTISVETMLTAIYGHQLLHMRELMRLAT